MYITLFEKQLIRSYLLSDQGEFFKNIYENYRINIITSKSLSEQIKISLAQFSIESFVSVTTFENYKEGFLARRISSIFKYGNKSVATVQFINYQRSLNGSLIKTFFRYCVYFLVANSKLLKKFLRYLYYSCLKLDKAKKCFSPELHLSRGDVLFVTSLSPLRGEDIPIAIFFKKQKTPVAATVRSWDNLIANGALLYLPDVFLCHSEYMLNGALTRQGFNVDKVVMATTPSYQYKFFQRKPSYKDEHVNFSYMCQGTVVNPDDKNFVRWLVDMWKEMPKNFDLYIIQHPSFIMQDLQIKLPTNIRMMTFPYHETSLVDYYSHLSRMNLVIGGGTTGVLDASFLEVPIVTIGFEIDPQNYWQSALRSFDYFPWTADFFNDSKITIAKTKESLVELILNYNSIDSLDTKTVKKYTGDPSVNISQVLLKALTKYQN